MTAPRVADAPRELRPPAAPGRPTAPARTLAALAVAVAAVALAVHAGVRANAFLYFDDGLYVTENPWVRAGLSWRGVAWAFTTLHAANWHPLTWLSHMLDVQLFGLDAGAHHLVNAAIHALNAALVLLVLARLTGAPLRSAAVALLFAVHPLRVESVAWVAERKDVLAACFGLLMLAAYGWYARRPAPGRYAAVVAALTASLLSKPSWVTAPFLLLLLDVWPLQRVAAAWAPRDPRCPLSPPRPLPALVLEKLPLLALSVASSAVTLMAQRRGGAVVSLAHTGLGDRLANALVSCVRYLGKHAWPAPLAPLYPMPAAGWGSGAALGAAVLLAAVTVAVLWNLRRWPWAAVGWCWFLGTLVPVLGLVQVGSQAMADRYTYLPGIGLAVAVVWSVASAMERLGRSARMVAAGGTFALAVLLSLLTVRQERLWSDQETLFRHTIAVTDGNGRAHLVLSQALLENGRPIEALVHAREAVRLDPSNPRAHKNLGFALFRAGLLEESVPEFERAVALDPEYAEAHGNLAIAYGKLGRFAEAAREMRTEQRLRAARPEP